MMVVCVAVAGFVRVAVLDDLTVSADIDMRVGEDWRQRIQHQGEPHKIEIPADYHWAALL